MSAVPKPAAHRPRAAIVGAGFGGLALALRLQAGGADVRR